MMDVETRGRVSGVEDVLSERVYVGAGRSIQTIVTDY
jgi:hypothetical protein